MSTTNVNVASTGPKFVGPGPVTARELNGKKGSAPPPPVDGSDSVEEVVTLTGDTGSRARFSQLWQIVLKAHKEQLWRDAVAATRTALAGPRKPVERPGAYFQAILTKLLTDAGVGVPVGSRSERETIRRIIATSFRAVAVDAAPVAGDSRPLGSELP